MFSHFCGLRHAQRRVFWITSLESCVSIDPVHNPIALRSDYLGSYCRDTPLVRSILMAHLAILEDPGLHDAATHIRGFHC